MKEGNYYDKKTENHAGADFDCGPASCRTEFCPGRRLAPVCTVLDPVSRDRL